MAGWLGLASMLALGGAFLALVGHASAWAIGTGTAGLVGLVAAVVLSSQAAPTARYRPRRLTRVDVEIGVARCSPRPG